MSAIWWWVPWEYRPGAQELNVPPTTFTFEDLSRKSNRILIVTAHPDDSEFYSAGTLVRLKTSGASTQLLVVTNGDKGYYPFTDPTLTAKVRQAEQSTVASDWGCDRVAYLGFPDGRFEPTRQLVDAIERHIREYRPNIVMTFDPEHPFKLAHGDHRKAGDAACEAARRVGGITLVCLATMAPNFTVDITHQWNDKLALVAGHKSQFFGSKLERINGMLNNAALRNGRRIGVKRGESYRVTR